MMFVHEVDSMMKRLLVYVDTFSIWSSASSRGTNFAANCAVAVASLLDNNSWRF